MRRALTFGFGGAAAGYGALRFLGRTAGSTRAERRARLPGDAMVLRPQIITDHAIDISAPASQVWPWLTQMGWHLGGYYTPAWVDRWLFRANWSSLDALDPALVRDLRVGDVIPDGPPGTAEYVVAEVGPGVLVLRSSTHVPTGWERHGAGIDWTWCLLLTPQADGRGTRLHLRIRGHMWPWWFAALYVVGIVPADLVMSQAMLRGLKRRAEGEQRPRPSGRPPLTR